MKVIKLKQKNNKEIADYMKKTDDLIKKMFRNDIEINIITFREMRKFYKKKQIFFECNKNVNYSFINVQKLVKAAYNEIEKPNFFDSKYKNNMKIVLSNNRLALF